MPNVQHSRTEPDWLRPAAQQEGLGYYIDVLKERIWVFVAIVTVTLAAAGLYLVTAENVYEGQANLLITPAPNDDPLAASLGLLRASNDPARDVETVASLGTTLEVAELAKTELGTDASARSLQRKVTAEPVASSNLVSITARQSSAAAAAELANAFANGLVADRTAALHDAVDALLPQLEDQLGRGAGGPAVTPEAATLQSNIDRLETYRAAPDPTVRVETEAVPAASPVSPRPMLTIVGALLAGSVLGIAGAFAVQTLDPRLRREEQLRSRYQLPILARVPRDSTRKGRPLGPAALAPQTKEAYRTLRANVMASRRDPQAPHSLLVTGSSPAEGKTTTAINLAGSLALAGNRVILIEADLRRPAIAQTLGIQVKLGVVSTLLENVSIEDALVTTPSFGPSLQLLLADYKGGWMSELFSLHAAQRLLAAAKAHADYVIVDSPPLTTVVDTMPLAREVDAVLIVTRLGETRLKKLPELAELLASNGITPLGFALIGTEPTDSDYYHDDANAAMPDDWDGDTLLAAGSSDTAPFDHSVSPPPPEREPGQNAGRESAERGERERERGA